MGRRMGASINKQYLQLAGKPILAHTISRFEQHPRIDNIIVIIPEAEIPFCQAEVVDRFDYRKVSAVVAGGAERQDSVRNGLEALEAEDDDLVLIHDGVRPLFEDDLVERMIDETLNHSACLAGVPVKDTIKEVEGGQVVATPARERLWQAQTPQAFRYGLIRDAHRRALEDAVVVTDDAMLAERDGHAVKMVMGSYRNIKITTPEDLAMAEAWLAEHQTEAS
jgi:2-C-methyl-D-erythritol 4-phosphate cytidylyltransferase